VPRKTALTGRKSRRVASESALPTREVILDTAGHLFAVRGVDGVALRDLAREMGLTAPSLYNHFPSKQALYDAVLERGVGPILEVLGEAWHPGALQPEQMRVTVDKLVTHLVSHPHLARLLQRALIEEAGNVQKLIARWLTPMYQEGMAIIRETAADAGWEPEEVPHLAIGMFGMIFSYFINTAILQTSAARGVDPMSPRALAVQRRFLEKAIYRLLGPDPKRANSKRARRARAARRRYNMACFSRSKRAIRSPIAEVMSSGAGPGDRKGLAQRHATCARRASVRQLRT
jgi:AcrR family transcriptional regulator